MIGEVVSHYRILNRLGGGGMGVVYQAEDLRLGRHVALKFLPDELCEDPEVLERFRREARSASALNHPNICTIHDIDQHNGREFIVMELLEGATLKHRLTNAPFNPELTIDYAIQILSAISAAHAKGIVHRDIKPANLFITDYGQVKVLDFGLAKLTVKPKKLGAAGSGDSGETASLAEEHLTSPGKTVGTIAYMSPEQARGEDLDPRTDLFSVGAVMYEMAAGRCAFSGNTTAVIFDSILHKTPAPASRVNPELPSELDRIIDRCLEKDRDLRYQTANDVCADLKRLRRNTSSTQTAVAVDHQPSSNKTRWKRPRLIALVAAALVVLAIAFAWFGFGRQKTIDSVAVLPFMNESSDPNSEYLSDGITEGVISSLSQNPHLRVMARSTVFRFKGKDFDPRQIGSELKVKAVLVGRMVERNNQVRIQADLVDVSDGSELWGAQYNRNSSDLASVHQEIARDLSNKLKMQMSGDMQKRMARGGTRNEEAYQLYLKGRFQWNLRTSDSLKQSIELFRQAVEKDPDFALAWVGLADTYAVFPGYTSEVSPEDMYSKAKDAAARALALDDSLPEAHVAVASTLANLHQFHEAEREYRKAIELKPSDANAHYFLSLLALVPTGRLDEAVTEIKTALQIDPMSPIINANAVRVFFYARQFDQALEQSQRALQIDPKFKPTHMKLLDVYESKGMFDKAVEEEIFLSSWNSPKLPDITPERAAVLRRSAAVEGARGYWKKKCEYYKQDLPKRTISKAMAAEACGAAGDLDTGFKLLKQAVAEYDEEAGWVVRNPVADVFHSDPRWNEVLRMMNLEGTQ